MFAVRYSHEDADPRNNGKDQRDEKHDAFKVGMFHLFIKLVWPPRTPTQAAHAICLWLSGLRAKQGMLPLLAHEVRPCLVYGEAVLEVGQGRVASFL